MFSLATLVSKVRQAQARRSAHSTLRHLSRRELDDLGIASDQIGEVAASLAQANFDRELALRGASTMRLSSVPAMARLARG